MPCYVILLTDGLATDLNQVLVPAQRMRAQGIRVIGVGIGKSVSHINLIGMSSKSNDVFSPENDDLLNTILRETSHRDCIGKKGLLFPLEFIEHHRMSVDLIVFICILHV